MNDERLSDLVLEAQEDFGKIVKVGDKVSDVVAKLEMMLAVVLQSCKSKESREAYLNNIVDNINFFRTTIEVEGDYDE